MNSKTILRNTIWYGIENVISFASSLITSIAVARTLGPEKMGYVIYVLWVANIASTLGSVGIPATARKYMAEYIGGKDFSTARFIYRRTLLAQTVTASVATVACVAWVLWSSPAEFRIASLLLVLSIWPSMVNFISAQANVASENLSANLPASAAATGTFFVLTMATIAFHWGVIGVAAAMLGMRLMDFLVRLVPTWRRIESWRGPDPNPPAGLRPRMFRFAAESMAGMALTLIVWDRSEVFLLKHLSADIRQIAFYSVAFSLAEKLLVFPTVFASATGASMFAQHGRDHTKVPALTAASARYLGLTSIPLHFIATSLAGAALRVMYGSQYDGAIIVSMAAPLLCLPKAFLTPIQTLFETVEKQRYFIYSTVVASIIDVAIAWLLIPRYGALGAAIGSGAAQVIAIVTLWALGIRQYRVRLPWTFLAKVSAVSAVAAACAGAVVWFSNAFIGLIVGGAVAVGVFVVLAALLQVFEEQDLARFKVLVDSCPASLAAPVNLTYSWLSRRVAPAATEELI